MAAENEIEEFMLTEMVDVVITRNMLAQPQSYSKYSTTRTEWASVLYLDSSHPRPEAQLELVGVGRTVPVPGRSYVRRIVLFVRVMLACAYTPSALSVGAYTNHQNKESDWH